MDLFIRQRPVVTNKTMPEDYWSVDELHQFDVAIHRYNQVENLIGTSPKTMLPKQIINGIIKGRNLDALNDDELSVLSKVINSGTSVWSDAITELAQLVVDSHMDFINHEVIVKPIKGEVNF